MVVYLIKSALCLLVLFTFYKLLLEEEHMHRFKRFYLLGSLVFSLVLPLVEFTYYTTAVSAEESTTYQVINSGAVASESLTQTTRFSDILPYLFGIIYLAGLVFFLFRFFRNLNKIFKRVKTNKNITTPYYTSVLLKEKLNPHSFLKYIFLNKKAYRNGEIEEEVLEHEAAHVKQKHSIDILIIEALQAIFWFNPLFILYKTSMQMNHEFLADKAVVERQGKAVDYSKLLFNYSAGPQQGLTSSFNHSLIKKRILMISKPFSEKRLATRLSLLVPVLGICILLFNNGISAKPLNNPDDQEITSVIPEQDPKQLNIKVSQDEIWVNKEEVEIENFSKAIDRFTADMTEEEIGELRLDINIQITRKEKDHSYLDRLNEEFRKTRLAKVTGQDLLPAAPPAPPAPEVTDAPAPPAPPAPASAPDAKEAPAAPKIVMSRKIEIVSEKESDGGEERITIKTGESREGPSISSMDDANIYFNGEKVTKEKAEELMKGKKNIKVEVKKINDKKAEVHITSKED